MNFDPNVHRNRMLVIRCGQILYPGEKNLTKLYNDTMRKLGMVPARMSTDTFSDDPNADLHRMLVISAGEKLREERGLPKVDDLEALFKDTAIELGLFPEKMEVSQSFPEPSKKQIVDHLPAPHEITDEKGEYFLPREDCPNCGRVKNVVIYYLCQSCAEAKDEQGNRYMSIQLCGERNRQNQLIPGSGCGYKKVNKKSIVQWLDETGKDWRSMSKRQMGIKTYTDQGIKE